MAKLPPGSKLPSFIQSYHWFRNTPSWMDQCTAKFGDIFTLRLPFSPPFIVVHNPEHIKAIFTADPDVLHGGEANYLLEPLTGKNSLMLQDGANHLKLRKLLLPPFHGERMQAYGETIATLTEQMLDRWQAGKHLSVLDEMHQLTQKVIIKTIFGVTESVKFNQLDSLLTNFSNALSKPASGFLAIKPSSAQTMMAMALKKFNVGSMRFQPGKLLPWYPLTQALHELNEFLFAEFADRRASNTPDRTDILSLLMAARHDDGSALNDWELRDQMVTVLPAGHETTTSALGWVFYFLLNNPQAEQRVRDELSRVTQGKPLQISQLSQLEYLDAILKESLRLYPVATGTPRLVKQPLRLGAYEIPAGAMLFVSTYLANRNPAVFAEPELFKPERFMEKRYSTTEYIPYGGGTRRCIGAAFAHYEIKIIMATLLQRVEFVADPLVKVTVGRRANIFLAPSHGMPIVIKAVKAKAANWQAK